MIVTPLLVEPYILDLLPGLSFVGHLTMQGLDVFLLDFGIPDCAGGSLRFGDYLGEIDLALEDVRRLGICLRDASRLLPRRDLAVLYTASNPQRVQNLITVAAPFDFSKAGPLYRWLQSLDGDRLVDAMGNVPGEWIRDQLRLFTSVTMPGRTLRL